MMDYSCGLGPHLGGSLRRGSNIRRSFSSSKHIGGIDWHLRTQFTEQTKCIELKLDIDCTILAELQDFYRRRAIVEQDYADALLKLASSLKQRHINETSKRPYWISYTTGTILNTLIGSTQRVSETHAVLAEVFSKQMIQRLVDMDEDAVRLHKQCREMMSVCQERVLSNTGKLQACQREYNTRQTATIEAERIRRRFEERLNAAELKARGKGKDPTTSQRYMRVQNDYAAKNMTYTNAVFATNRARNDYLLQLAATNHSLQRYFSEEAPDIIDCLACGFHNSLARSVMMHLSCENALKTCHGSIVEMLNRNITALDWRQDKASFLKRNEGSFSRPNPFTLFRAKDDTKSDLFCGGALTQQLGITVQQLSTEIDQLRVSTEEIWKTLEVVEKRLSELINQKDYDVSVLFFKNHPRPRRSIPAPGCNTNRSSASGSSLCSVGVTGTPGSQLSSSPAASPALGRSSNQSNTVLSSVSVPATPGSTGTVAPQQDPQQPTSADLNSTVNDNLGGLYSNFRALYRDARIDQEKFYLDRFTSYTQEMHQLQLLQVKLNEIQRALSCSSNTPHGESPPALSLTSQPTGGNVRCGVQVLPKLQLFAPSSRNARGSSDNISDDGLTHQALPSPPPEPKLKALPGLGLDWASTSLPASFNNGSSGSPGSNVLLVKPQSRRVLCVPKIGAPKLFGGTIDEYVEATKQPIPHFLLSCTRVIVLFGMQQQGIFRVSGSQTDIAEFKAAFERDEDPLQNVTDARDINSIASLLKLYFRELGEPPFPDSIFIHLITCARERSGIDETINHLRHVVTQGLSKPVFVVLRYLFAFLNHVAEHADENMMDAYNLAVCFTPTLVPIPTDLNQVQYQTTVIDIIKLFITHHLSIFDPMIPGPLYVKHTFDASNRRASLSVESLVNSRGGGLRSLASAVAQTALRRLAVEQSSVGSCVNPDAKSSSTGDLVDGGHSTGRTSFDDDLLLSANKGDGNSLDDLQSISDSECCESRYTVAVARADFSGSTARELSFTKGSELLLFRRRNDHWWDGQLGNDSSGRIGLVPHAYIVPKTALMHLEEDTMKPEQIEGHSKMDELDHQPEGFDDQVLAAGVDGNEIDAVDLPLSSDSASLSNTPNHSNRPSSDLDPRTSLPRAVDLVPANVVADYPPDSTLVRRNLDTDVISTSSKNEENDVNDALKDSVSDSICSSPNSNVSFEGSVDDFGIPSTARSTSSRLLPTFPPSNSLDSVPEHELASVTTTVATPPSTLPSDHAQQGPLNADFDSELAEVLLDLTSLEQANSYGNKYHTLERSRELGRKLQLPCAKHTPDLVMGLPVNPTARGRRSSLSTMGLHPYTSESANSSADTFAEQGVDTMRKRPESCNAPTASSETVTVEKPRIPLTFMHSHHTETTNTPGDGSNLSLKDFKTTAESKEHSSAKPVPAIRSIADRVAAFEVSGCRPAVAPKPRRT